MPDKKTDDRVQREPNPPVTKKRRELAPMDCPHPGCGKKNVTLAHMLQHGGTITLRCPACGKAEASPAHIMGHRGGSAPSETRGRSQSAAKKSASAANLEKGRPARARARLLEGIQFWLPHLTKEFFDEVENLRPKKP